MEPDIDNHSVNHVAVPGYVVQRQIGKGGMATVYLAIQESLQREVVLKILDLRHVAGEDLVERFLAEGRIVAALRHPNIVTVYDIGVAGQNLFISMEYVQGGDLKDRMRASTIAPDQALDYVRQIAGALRVAHQRGIVHRDVKPANILFREDGTPLLGDFGIAKQMNIDQELTSTGIFLGSPNYVSPEQAEGLKVDGRADIYSLGCILYEMLTGSKPYQFSSVIDLVVQHKHAPIPRLPEELQDCQSLLEQMMAKTPKERFQDADELIEAVETLLQERRLRTYAVVKAGELAAQAQPQAAGGRRMLPVLIALMIVSAGFFGAVQYVDARLRASGIDIDEVPTASTLPENAGALTPATASPSPALADASPAAETADAASAEVMRALLWLGNQSLEEYKLTYPPKDNAYYYFSKLLEIDPGNSQARAGILEIANRYAVLAERALAQNEYEKTEAYINLGLKIDPQNETLLSLKALVEERPGDVFAKVKQLFGGR
jgi:tRNA A-37 threonylcarbamoyl transferase component Bud32